MIEEKILVSVILPVYLSYYPHSASKKEVKFRRAVNSFIKQTYSNRELIIISDGCTLSEDIYKKDFAHHRNIRFKLIPKQPMFSGIPRNEGLKMAEGNLITYLCYDDYMETTHLGNIAYGFFSDDGYDPDWVYFNDYIKKDKHWNTQRNVQLAKGLCGTSSIAHKKEIKVDWQGCDGRGHEWMFITKLINTSSRKKKIWNCGYIIAFKKDVVDL